MFSGASCSRAVFSLLNSDAFKVTTPINQSRLSHFIFDLLIANEGREPDMLFAIHYDAFFDLRSRALHFNS